MSAQQTERMNGLTLAIAGVAAISGLLIGYDTAVIAGALVFIADEFALPTLLKATVVTSILVGALAGAIASGMLSQRFGQRPVLLAAAVIYTVCAAALYVADDIYAVIGWRTGLGAAVGISSMVAPLYLSETAPRRWRGALVSMVQLAITLGILVSYLVGYYFDDHGDWRSMLGCGALPGLALFLGLLFLPESPRWLVLQGRLDEARADFKRIRGHAWDEDEIVLISNAGVEQAGWSALFSPKVRPVLVVAAGLFLLQNLSGIDAILYYAPTIFSFVGFTSSTGQILATAGLGAVNVVATVLAMWLVDRSGRRPLLLGGTAIMAISMATLAFCLSFGAGADWADQLAVIALAVYIIAFALSLGPLPYVLMAEVFPLRVRSLGMSIAAATAWMLNIGVTITFLSLIETIGVGGTFWLYSGVCLLALVFAQSTVPETKGCSLEQIEANLAAGLRTRDLGV